MHIKNRATLTKALLKDWTPVWKLQIYFSESEGNMCRVYSRWKYFFGRIELKVNWKYGWDFCVSVFFWELEPFLINEILNSSDWKILQYCLKVLKW